MVVFALIEQLPQEIKKDLIIVNAFENSEIVAKNLSKYGKQWGSTCYKNTHREAYQYASGERYSKLFIDSDVGMQKYLQLILYKFRSPNTFFAVYEEGLGTYREDLYQRWKKFFLQSIGAASFFGGCRLTKEIYIYDPNEYCEKFPKKYANAFRLMMSIEQLIARFQEVLLKIFGAEQLTLDITQACGETSCVIYLTNWSINERVLENLSTCAGVKLMKLHPHIKIARQFNTCGFLPIAPSIPAEILITYASKKFKKIRVFHDGSSVGRYVSPGNVEFIKVE